MFWDQEHKLIREAYVQSWDHIEEFWNEQHRHFPKPLNTEILAFIWALRERGYDQKLKATALLDVEDGMLIFMLHRSAYYGTRADQVCLAFILIDTDQIDIRFSALHVNYMFSVKHLELTPQIEDLLHLMLAHMID